MRVTLCSFCAETEMAQVLRMKAATNGLCTDKLDGRNCTIRTAPFEADNHKVIVTIGREIVLPFGGFGSFGSDDLNNALFGSEEHTRASYDEPARQGE